MTLAAYSPEDLKDLAETESEGRSDADAAHAATVARFDGPPLPLRSARPVPPFPADAFPRTVADMIGAVAVFTQTDPAMAGTVALSALAACTTGRVEVEPRPGWTEPCCVYTATCAHPAERKSSVLRVMTEPIVAAEMDLAQSTEQDRVQALTELKIAKRDADQAAASAAGDGENKTARVQAAIDAAEYAEGITVPPVPRLIADDVTPEKAVSMLAEQGGRLAILSAEGGIFDIIAGRYSGSVPNLEVWLKGHAGDSIRVDRKGRDAEHIPSPAMTVGVMIQPSVLDALARHDSFRGRGLLARFLFARPVSRVGRRDPDPPLIPDAVRTEYAATVRHVLDVARQYDEEPARLTMEPDAADLVVNLMGEVETQLAGNGDLAHLADWGGKYVGAVIRIAGILHMVEHWPGRPIDVDTVQAAMRIGAYYRSAAIATFTDMGADGLMADVEYLLNRIRKSGEEVLSKRDMMRGARRFTSMEDMEPALDRLVEYGYLLEDAPQQSTGGRRPSPRYWVNPLEPEA